MTNFRYRGTDRRGSGRTGCVQATSAAALAKEKYDAGWRRLVIERADMDGVEVGAIWPHADTGQRTWYGDTDTDLKASTDMTTNRITITGQAARELRTAAAALKSGTGWTEVRLSDCAHGCKIHARKRGSITQFAILHSATYGCALGRDEATATEPVSVRPGLSDAPTVTEAEFHAESLDVAAGEMADRDDAAMRAAEADTQAEEDRQADLADREADMAGAYEMPYRTGEDEIEYADESDYSYA